MTIAWKRCELLWREFRFDLFHYHEMVRTTSTPQAAKRQRGRPLRAAPACAQDEYYTHLPVSPLPDSDICVMVGLPAASVTG